MNIRNLRSPQQSQRAELCLRYAVFQREILRQRVTHAHQHAALDLSLDGDRIDHLAGIMRRPYLLHPAVVVQDDHVRRVSIGNMALRVGQVGAQFVRRFKVLIEEFPAVQGGKVSPCLLQRLIQLQRGSTHRFARKQRLSGSGRRAGIRRGFRTAAAVPDLRERQTRSLRHVLAEHRQAALANVRGRAVDHALPVFDHQFRPALVRQADAHARVLHRAGDSGMIPVGFIYIFDCQQRFLQRRGAVGDLSVRQHLARFNGVAEPDLPRGDPDLFRQQIDHALQRELALAHAETAECAGGRIVGIVSVSPDVRVLVAIRADGMSAGPLQHRSAQGGVRAGIKINIAVQRRENPVLIASQGEGALHGVAFRMEVDGLLAAEPGLHRPLADPGCQGGDMLDRYVLLAAEPAAHQLVFHHNPLRIPAEHDGCFLAGVIDALVRAQDLDAVLVRERHRAFRFQERVLGKGRGERLCDRIGGSRQRRSRVSPGYVPGLAQIAFAVHLRRVRCHRLRDGGDRRQHFIFDSDFLFRFLQDLLGLGHHQADGVAHAAGNVPDGDHHIPVLLKVPHLVVRHIRRRQHRDHAFHGEGFRRVDGLDPRPRVL